MAIVFEEKQRFNWGALLTSIGVTVAIAVLAYILFFAPVPAINEIIPLQVKSTTELSTVQLNPNDLLRNDKYKFLNPQPYEGVSAIPPVGKANPFVKF